MGLEIVLDNNGQRTSATPQITPSEEWEKYFLDALFSAQVGPGAFGSAAFAGGAHFASIGKIPVTAPAGVLRACQ